MFSLSAYFIWPNDVFFPSQKCWKQSPMLLWKRIISRNPFGDDIPRNRIFQNYVNVQFPTWQEDIFLKIALFSFPQVWSIKNCFFQVTNWNSLIETPHFADGIRMCRTTTPRFGNGNHSTQTTLFQYGSLQVLNTDYIFCSSNDTCPSMDNYYYLLNSFDLSTYD